VKETNKVNSKTFWIKKRRISFLKDQSKSLLSLPNGTDLTLKPIEVYEMPVRLLANEEGGLLNHLEIIIEDSKIM